MPIREGDDRESRIINQDNLDGGWKQNRRHSARGLVARIPGLVCGACAIEIAARGPLVTHEESPTQQQH